MTPRNFEFQLLRMMKFVNFFLPQRLVFSVENYYRAVIKGKRTFLDELVNLKFLLESFGKKTIVRVV